LKVSEPKTYEVLFDYYDNVIIPSADESLKDILSLINNNRVALTCFEKDSKFLNRSRITKILEVNTSNIIKNVK